MGRNKKDATQDVLNLYNQMQEDENIESGKEEIKVIAEKVGGLLCQKIGNIVLCNVDAIVISSFLGLRILGIYNGYFYVISTLMGFLYIIQQTLIPSVGSSIAKESKEKNYKDFSKFQYIYICGLYHGAQYAC